MTHPAIKIGLIFTLAASLGACGNDETQAQTKPNTSSKQAVHIEQAPKNHVQPSETVTTTNQENAMKVEVNQPVKAASMAEGKQRYEQTCRVCHDQGLLDAPKLTDKAEWAKRLEKGVDVLYEHSAKGYNKMPAQATGAVSEAEVYAAVDYMLEQVK